MRRQSRARLVGVTALLPLLLAVSGCGGRAIPVQTFPPSADVKAVTEPKPRPTPDIVTDPQANERYNAAVESALDRAYSAGVRLCKFLKEIGAPYPFECER